MYSAMICVEMTFEEACQAQHALEQRVETSTAALQALASVMPAAALITTQEQIAAANHALAKLKRSLDANSRRVYDRAG